MNRILPLLLVLLLSCTVFGTLVHFVTVNDCHSVMEPFGTRDPETLTASFGGYARAVTVIDSLRSLYPDLIACHAGDWLTGDLFTPVTMGRAVLDLWISAGFRAFVLGNHEFDYGPYLLNSVLETIDAPLISANLDPTGFSFIASNVSPYRIIKYPTDIEGDSINIAIIGSTSEIANTAGWIAPLSLSNAVEAIEDIGLPPEADCAIALTHLDMWEDELIAAMPFIDAVIGGHDHTVTIEPNWVFEGADSTAIVKAGAYIRYVGHLVMEYVPESGLRFVDWNAIPIDHHISESPSARAHLDAYRDTISSVIGYDPYDAVAFFADSVFNRYPTVVGYEDSPAGNLVTDAYRHALDADIGFEARGSMRMSIYPGTVTHADLFRVMPMGYDPASQLNARLVRMQLSGTELKNLLEFAFIAGEFSKETFPQFSGISLRYNPDAPIMGKVETSSLYINGVLWEGGGSYSFASSDLLIHALDMIGYRYPAVDTSETTAYHAIVAYCTSEDFEPVYSSQGRIVNARYSVGEATMQPDNPVLSAFPNPFNSAITIMSPEDAKIEIFDIMGNRKAFLGHGIRTWRPEDDIPSGIYHIHAITENGQNIVKRVVYIK